MRLGRLVLLALLVGGCNPKNATLRTVERQLRRELGDRHDLTASFLNDSTHLQIEARDRETVAALILSDSLARFLAMAGLRAHPRSEILASVRVLALEPTDNPAMTRILRTVVFPAAVLRRDGAAAPT